MYMSGFSTVFSSSQQRECLNLFFTVWTLNTPWKFALAWVGIVLLGMSVELILLLRQKLQVRLQRAKSSSSISEVVMTLTYGIHMAIAYFLMLAAMTYSVEIFVAVILGLMLGRFCFNRRAGAAGEGEPCCEATSMPQPKPAKMSYVANDTPMVPTAVTPTRTLELVGLTCEKCQNKCLKALNAVPGTYSVSITLVPGGISTAEVLGDADAAEWINAITNLGYSCRQYAQVADPNLSAY